MPTPDPAFDGMRKRFVQAFAEELADDFRDTAMSGRPYLDREWLIIAMVEGVESWIQKRMPKMPECFRGYNYDRLHEKAFDYAKQEVEAILTAEQMPPGRWGVFWSRYRDLFGVPNEVVSPQSEWQASRSVKVFRGPHYGKVGKILYEQGEGIVIDIKGKAIELVAKADVKILPHVPAT